MKLGPHFSSTPSKGKYLAVPLEQLYEDNYLLERDLRSTVWLLRLAVLCCTLLGVALFARLF